ncbi:MAG: hypothetical protein D6689_08045 [Deltaproteobacteria bacterium]|nr:MAG: hypothetical protein D6689_08045 [Deltaproteobacteria bacterium]
MNPRTLARIERMNYALTAGAAVLGALVLDRPHAIGLTVGALVASVNFSVIRHLVGRLFDRRDAAAASRRRAAMLFIPKMAALMAVVFVAIHYLPLSAVAFAVGFSTFILSIAIESIRFAATH